MAGAPAVPPELIPLETHGLEGLADPPWDHGVIEGGGAAPEDARPAPKAIKASARKNGGADEKPPRAARAPTAGTGSPGAAAAGGPGGRRSAAVRRSAVLSRREDPP